MVTLSNKDQLLRNYQKTESLHTIIGYIFISRNQPFKAENISAAFFICRQMMKHNSCHKFSNKFQDDISYALAIYSYM